MSADLFTFLNSADNKKLFEYGRNLFVCQDFGFCHDFVSIKEGRRTNLDP